MAAPKARQPRVQAEVPLLRDVCRSLPQWPPATWPNSATRTFSYKTQRRGVYSVRLSGVSSLRGSGVTGPGGARMLRRGPFLLPEQGGPYRSRAIAHSFCVPTPQLRGPDFFFKGKGGFWNHSLVSGQHSVSTGQNPQALSSRWVWGLPTMER